MVSVERKAYKRTIVSAKNIQAKKHFSEDASQRKTKTPSLTPSNLVMNIIAGKREEACDF